MPGPNDNNLTFEDVRIVFRNFAGKEGQYNREGDRNFAVLLDEGMARHLEDTGWNVKYLKPREDGDEPQPYLPVAVSYKGRPPRVVMITSKGRTPLDESQVEVLDWVEIKTVDLIVRPYDWVVNGKSGRKAYLQSIFVIIFEDALELKYADVQEIGAGPQHLAIESGNIIDAEVIE